MIEWLLGHALAWYGLGGTLLILCAVLFWYFPEHRKSILTAAIGIAIALFSYGRGESNAKRKADAKRAADEAEAARRSRQARDDAERDIDADPDGVRNDPRNRDN